MMRATLFWVRSRLRGDQLQAQLGAVFIAAGAPLAQYPSRLLTMFLQGFALLKPAILLQKEAHRPDPLPVGRVVRAGAATTKHSPACTADGPPAAGSCSNTSNPAPA